MIALICCLLALSGSAYARAYGSYPSQPVVRELPVQTGYGYQSNDHSTGMIGNPEPDTRTLPVSNFDSYGGSQLQQKSNFFVPKSSRVFSSQQQKLLEQQQELQEKIEESQIVTEADILCRGQQPEVVIPLDSGRRYVSCIADGKGLEQWCPQGLLYHVELQRCERRLGPSQDFCISQPCLNGGRCISELSTFRCQCQAGFDGKTCELDARVCQTQRPCGTAPDTRCQSFRPEASLDYICIFQNGQSYGFNAQQIHSNPCTGIDGVQSLANSDKGFVLCDGESMNIDSCPLGTVWDKASTACVWPEMGEDYSYGYGQRAIVPKSSYGSVAQKRVLPQQYGQTVEPKVLPQQYGQTVEPKVLPQQYGQTVEPKVLPQQYGHAVEQTRVLPQQYGHTVEPKVLPQQYGHTVEPKVLPQQYGHTVEQTRVLPQQYGQTVEPKVLPQQYGHTIEQTRVLPQQYGHTVEPKVLRTVQPSGY